MPSLFSSKNFFGQWAKLDLVKVDLSEKTVIVVGANVGLGLEAARHFASMNPRKLILACRSQERGDAAVQDIKATTSCKSVECWTVDLADFKSISAFADRFENDGGGHLDLMVENAAVACVDFKQTKDGWERTLQVNHIGTALLALLLLPSMSKADASGPFPRLVVVSSGVHFWIESLTEAQNDHILNTLNSKEHSKPQVMAARYNVSKLFNMFFVRELASRLKSDGHITVDAVNPGFCTSELRREMHEKAPFVTRVLLSFMEIFFARSTETGSRTLVHAALSGTQAEMQGKYLSHCRVEPESSYVTSEEGQKVQKRLWNETMEILRKADPRVGAIADRYLTSA